MKSAEDWGVMHMEFYKLVQTPDGYHLEEEDGQEGMQLDNRHLSWLAGELYQCYLEQENLPLRFRRYMMAYYESGETEYVALAESAVLTEKPLMDGFASTWLEGEEENRVWIGCDGAIENRGPSAAKVRSVLERLIEGLRKEDCI